MKQIVLIAMVAVLSSPLATGDGIAAANVQEKIEKQILDVEQERDQAIQNRDIRVLDHIQTDDFTFVNTRGGLFSKKEYEDDIRTGSIKFLSFKQDDYHFQIYPDAVIVTGRSAGVVEYHGKTNGTPRRFTMVYVRIEGKWRLATYHGTLIAEQ